MTKVTDVIGHHVRLAANAENANYRLVVVEVVTSSGLRGYGELGLAYGAGARASVQAVAELGAHYLIGRDAHDIAAFTERAYRNGFWLQNGGPVLHGAVSAIDQALWDIKGKALGVPVHQLLGGAVRPQIRLYCNGWSRSLGQPEALAEAAAREAEAGFTALKFDPYKYDAKGQRTPLNGVIGPDLHRLGVARMQAVRDAVGPDVDILLELHGNLSPLDALRACRDMADVRPLFVEEPIDCSDAGVLAAFGQKAGLPLAAGERIFTAAGFRPLLEAKAVAVIQPDLGLCGGITEAMRISAMAQAFQVQVQPHNCGGPLSTAACLQIASVIPNLLFQEIFPHFADLRQDLVENAFERRIVRGHLPPPDAPGMGLEVNRALLERQSDSIRAAA